jgi:hypothetical protein
MLLGNVFLALENSTIGNKKRFIEFKMQEGFENLFYKKRN